MGFYLFEQCRSAIYIFPLSLTLGILSGCQDHRDTSIDTFGELDSSVVAADTTMQINMDRSYEYQKSLVENDTTVYDFLAYDKPKGSSSPDWESKFIVIKRTTHTYDTIIKDFRTGAVKGLSLADLDQDHRQEILFYETPKTGLDKWVVRVYTSPQPGIPYHEVSLQARHIPAQSGYYTGADTFFPVANHHYLGHHYTRYSSKDSLLSAEEVSYYKLYHGRIVEEKPFREVSLGH